jgi:hypothetical protein
MTSDQYDRIDQALGVIVATFEESGKGKLCEDAKRDVDSIRKNAKFKRDTAANPLKATLKAT